MNRVLIAAAFVSGLAIDTGAHAAKTEPKPATESGTAAAARDAEDKAAKDKGVADAMTDALRKSGFTDLQVMPNSILVRGKDKSGNPVAMVLNPGTMTEMVTLDPHSGPAAGGNGTKTPLMGSSPFVTVLPSTRMASTLIGLKVRGPANSDIGTIKDLAIDHDGIQAYILSVGGILGLGDRTIAVAPSALALVYDKAANAYSVTLKTGADQINRAPAFDYTGAKAKRD